MQLVHVYIEHATMQLDRTFTYRSTFPIQEGVRVQVPFASTKCIGFVMKVEEMTKDASFPYVLKDVIKVIDETPLLPQELIQLAHWMAQQYVSSTIACLQCMLPSKLKPQSNRKRIKKTNWIVYDKTIEGLSKRQQEVLQEIQSQKMLLYKDAREQYKGVVKTLLDKGCIRLESKEVEAVLAYQKPHPSTFTLHPDQQNALRKIAPYIERKDGYGTFLLHGVTGSGKTEVFLRLAEHAIQQGKQVLILVPEIGLTPQMVKRVTHRFGSLVAIYHSGLNAQEKYEQYMLVKQQKVSIVVGTRSAIFLPFTKLGLLVLDEEHDASYKQENMPRYHCKDIAIQRASYHQCPLVLASATPSLETFARAYKGVYHYVGMPNRVNHNLPKVEVVSMQKAIKQKESYVLSNTLKMKIQERLDKREQVILLLNRRGYSSILRCIQCGHIVMCPHCDIAMSYHKEEHVLKCHICSMTKPLLQTCPNCHEQTFRHLGMGTQKLQEYLQQCFPQAKILRMDADTTSRKFAHEKILEAFQNKEADILLGTQMIAKGLDFPDVTLVGILNGDAALQRSDYRSAEFTYDLLEQACGRSGRHHKEGEVIIQAYDVDHYAIHCAQNHDYVSFFKQEMQYRHLADYPPYSYLASLILRAKKEMEAYEDASIYASKIKEKKICRVLGPASLGKRKDEYRVRILLKGKDEAMLNQVVWEIYRMHLAKKTRVKMDVDMQPWILE